MAAIFQIRRGTSNVSLTEGELYLHQGSGSLQFGSGSTKYNTLTLDAPVKGDINLIGSISASGDVRIGGNIYLGDSAASDNISALGIFTTNLVPNGTIDLGTPSAKWNNVYGNSIWGAISASNGVVSGSAQFIGVLSSLNDYTASQNTKNSTLSNVTASFNIHTSSINSFTSSQESKDVIIGNYTASMNTFTASVEGHISDINTKTGSFETKNITIAAYTASMNTFTASVNGHISDINTKTGSFENKFTAVEASTSSLNTFTASVNGHITDINTKTGSFETKWETLSNVTTSVLLYTQSLKDAITVSGLDGSSTTTIKGNLVVQGTQTSINSTTIQLGDNIIELNGSGVANGGLLVKDPTAVSTISGSLLWDSTNDYWKGGQLGVESKILLAGGDEVISGSLSSLNSFSASVNGHIVDINIKTGSFETKNITIAAYTASMNTFTASVNGHITDINTKTGSFESKFTTLGLYTSSLDTKNNTLQTLTASMEAQFTRIQESTASLNSYTASQDTKNSTLATYTASVSVHITDINTKTGSFESKFTTLETYTASLDTKNNTLGTYTASINTKFSTLQTLTASVESQISRIQESTASLNTFSASINAFYNNFTASLANNGFSASVDKRLDDVEYTVTILDPGNIGQALLGINLVTQSLQNYTSSQDTKNIIIGSYTSSMNTFTASVEGHISDINTKTGSFETKFNTLGLYTASIDSHISNLNTATSSYETKGRGIVSGSSQVTPLLPIGTVSGSSQIFGGSGLVSGSSQITYVNISSIPSGIVSASSQVSYIGLSNIPSGIISSSAQIDTLFNIDGLVSGSSQINFTQLSGISANIISASSDTSNVDMIITGGSISANLYGGVVSGSAQVVSILTSLNSFSASNDNTSLNAATSSYETKGRGIVSGSIQVLGGSNVLSGSNQTNITSINQNLGTTTTGVQFASLGIGTAPDATYELKIEGDIAASGDIVAYYTSDKRLKNNIEPIQNALDKVNELGGYTFDWNEELQKARKGHDIGVIAQEVQSVLPEVVVERDNGYLGVDYQKLVPVLIEAIKELSAKVKDLENK